MNELNRFGELQRVASHLTPEVIEMQGRLYGAASKGIAPVADAMVRKVLTGLRGEAHCEPFRIWLVGSRLSPDKIRSDIDLILSPREGTSPDDAAIERGLLCCRSYGLYRAAPRCLMDPCFRSSGPSVNEVPLGPSQRLKGTKLFCPNLMLEVITGRVKDYRSVGRYCMEFVREAGDTRFFGKLPSRQFDRQPLPYLRPALEITGTFAMPYDG